MNRIATLARAALLLAPLVALQAAAGTWIALSGGNASGTWATGSNWSPAVVPDATNAVADFSTLNLTANSTVTLGAPVTVGGLVFGDTTPSHSWTVSGSAVTLATSVGSPTLTVKNQTVTFSAALSGIQGLVKGGTGYAVFGGGVTNFLTGALFVNAGTLGTTAGASMKNITGTVTVSTGATFNAAQKFDSNNFTNDFFISGNGYGLNGWGALNIQYNATLTGAITLNADATISHDSNIATINGPVTGTNTNLKLTTLNSSQYGFYVNGNIQLGTGALTLSGVGTVGSPDFTLSGNNSYSGTVVSAGTVRFGAVNALGSGTFSFAGNSTLQAGVGGALGNVLSVSPGVTGTFDSQDNAVTLSGALSGSGALTKTGTGRLTLAGGTNNTLTGALSVQAGSLQSANGASLKKLTGGITVAAGATFDANQNFDSNTIANKFSLSGAGSGYSGWGALNIQYNTTLTNVITLAADATISHDWNIATINGAIIGTNKNLKLTTLQSGQYGFYVNGNIQLGTGALTLSGVGTVGSPDFTLNGSNGFSAVTVTAGVLYFQSDAAMGGSGANVTVSTNGVAARNGSNMYTLLSRMSTNSAGAVAFNGGTSTDALAFTNFPSLSLGARVSTTYSGALTPGGGSYRLGGGGATLTMNTALTGTNGLIVNDAQGGTVVLVGAHTYTGATVVNAGTLRADGTLTGALTVRSSGTLAPGPASGIGSLTLTQPVTVSGAVSLRINRNSAQTADLLTAPALTLSGALTVVNSGSAPQVGDTFQLFSVSGATVMAQPALNLPTLAAGLTWDVTGLAVNGTIKAVAIGNRVGDPNWPGLLPYQIQSAYNAGFSGITVNSGTYAMPDTSGANFSFSSLTNFTITASNALFIVGTTDAFDFNNCTNVTLQGATIRPRTYPFTQGLVLNKGFTNGTVPYADWRVSDGYTTSFQWWFNAVSGSNRIISVETGDLYFDQANATYLGNNTWRLSFPGSTQLVFQVNDWLVARATQGQGFAVYLNGCNNCTLQGVTSQSGGFATFRENGGGGNRMLACRIQPSPAAPSGGTEKPVVACAADGVHTTWTYPGMHLEDCVFEGAMLDDNIAIHGSFQTVLSAADNTVVFDGAGRFAVNDPVRISSGAGFFAQATCTALQSLGGGQVQLTLDQTLPVPVGARASNPKYNGAGFRIINCQLGNTRSRSIITKADSGLVSGCTIRAAGMSAVQIGPEYYWNESDYSWSVTVSNNTIESCGDGVTVRTEGAIGNANITVVNNAFGDILNGSAVSIEGCAGATVTGNTFAPPRASPSMWFKDATNVVLACNLVTYVPGCGAMVGLGANVQSIQGVANGAFYSALPYALTNALSGLPLADPGYGGAGTAVRQFAHFNAAGRWLVEPAGGGYCRIVSAANGLALGVNGSSACGAPLVLEASGTADSQLWRLSPCGATAVNLLNKASGLSAAVRTSNPGEAVLQDSPGSGAGQQWIPAIDDGACAGCQTWTGAGSDKSWDTATANWSGSAWTNGNDAIFGSMGIGTVSLGSGVTANSLTFNTAGYALSGGALRLTGAAAITVNAGAIVISSVIAGSECLTFSGPGTLVLKAANTYTGPTTVASGVLRVDGSLATPSMTVCSGGAFAAGTTGLVGRACIAGTLIFQDSSALWVDVMPPLADAVAVTGDVLIGSNVELRVSGDQSRSGSWKVVEASGAISGGFVLAGGMNGAKLTKAASAVWLTIPSKGTRIQVL